MEGRKKLILMMLLPTVVIAVSDRRIEGNRGVDRKSEFLRHCFGPFPAAGSAERLRELRRNAECEQGDFRVVVLGKVRAFLLDEVCAALQTVASAKGHNVDREAVLPHANRFLELKLEDPFSQKNGNVCIYNVPPDRLPRSVFTYFARSYLVSSKAIERFMDDEGINFD